MMKRTRDDTAMNLHSTGRCLLENAALRNDAHVLRQLVLSVPRLGRAAIYPVKSAVRDEYEYMLKYFVHISYYPGSFFGASAKIIYNHHHRFHRLDGPARILRFRDGTYELDWYVHGYRHRCDGPAQELRNGAKVWWLHGEVHRAGKGPSVEHPDGSKAYYHKGRIVGITGPAVVWATGHGVDDWWQAAGWASYRR